MVKIGVVGIGNMGSGHVKYLFAGDIKNTCLTAVCDINPQRLEWAREHCGEKIKCFDSYKDMLKSGEIDAVYIATPHYLHPPMAIEAFEAGKHVLIKKPAGVYTKQVEQMYEAYEKSRCSFAIMYNQRTNPYYRKIRDMVKNGELGKSIRMVWIITNWYRNQAYYNSGGWRATWKGEGGGVLINQCPHNLDLWQWMFGMPKRVKGFTQNGKFHDIEVEDEACAYAEYENGATAIFITTTGEFPGTNRLEITGDRGKLVFEHGKLTFYKLDVPEREFNKTSETPFASPRCEEIDITIDEMETAYRGISQNFINNILIGEELLSPATEGINGLSISNAIHMSSWLDSWVELPIDSERFLSLLNERIEASSKKTIVKEAIVSQA